MRPLAIIPLLILAGCHTAPPQRSDTLYIAAGMPLEQVDAAIVANGGEDWSANSGYLYQYDKSQPYWSVRHYQLGNGANLTLHVDKPTARDPYQVIWMDLHDSAGRRQDKMEHYYGVGVIKIAGDRLTLWGLPDLTAYDDDRRTPQPTRLIHQGMRWIEAAGIIEEAALVAVDTPSDLPATGVGRWTSYTIGERSVHFRVGPDSASGEQTLKVIVVEAVAVKLRSLTEPVESPRSARVRFQVLDLNRPMPREWEHRLGWGEWKPEAEGD